MFLSIKARSVFVKAPRLAGSRRSSHILWLSIEHALHARDSSTLTCINCQCASLLPGRPAIPNKKQILLHILVGESAEELLLSSSCCVSKLSSNILSYSPFPKLISGLSQTHLINMKVVWANIEEYHHRTRWGRLTTILQFFRITWKTQR